MRKDMPKVLTEPVRGGCGYYRDLPNDYRQAKKFKLNEDLEVSDEFCSTILPMRAKRVGWDGKDRRFNTNPIRRFLRSKIGKKWDDIFSEFSSVFKEGIRGNHSGYNAGRDILGWYVEDCYVVDDQLYSLNGTLIETFYNTLYVDPRDGILKVTVGESYKARNRRYKAEYINKDFVVIDGIKFQRIDETWFRIEEIEIKTYTSSRIHYRTLKHTLSKAEIKRFNL